jgi:hypothetical protein
MKHPARALIAIAAIAALVPQTVANAEPLTHVRTVGCATTMTFLVWPHGHQAVPSIGFANLPVPHMEIYRGDGTSYSDSKFLGWAAGGKTQEPSPATSPNCLSFASAPTSVKPIGAMATIARTAAVTCTFPASGSIDIKKASSGKFRYKIRVLLSRGRLAAQTDIGPAGVRFHYPAKICHVHAAPAP